MHHLEAGELLVLSLCALALGTLLIGLGLVRWARK